jgi:hypothetical protein
MLNSSGWQQILVLTFVGLAAGYVAWRVRLFCSRDSRAGGCASCSVNSRAESRGPKILPLSQIEDWTDKEDDREI